MMGRRIFLAVISAALLCACSVKKPEGVPGGSIGLKDADSPFIAFNIWVCAGSQNDPAGKEGLASLTASFLADSGTKNNSYEEILSKLYPMATGYGASVDKEMTNITGRVHKDNLEAYYSIFKDAILAPAFDPDDFQRVKTQTMNYLKQTRRFSNDEELTKELLFQAIYSGTPYAHPEEGYVTTVESITLEDVKAFYGQYYTKNNITVSVGGGFPSGFKRRVRDDFDTLPSGDPVSAPKPEPASIEGIHVLLVEKDTGSSPVSFGFPIKLLRGDGDFYAMMLFNSAMGEHRNSFGRLYQVIRETRGINYGDYCYIEAYPEGYSTQVPPVNVGRRSQIFEVWLRPIAATAPGTLHDRTLFTIRTAMREFQNVIDEGMNAGSFEATQRFLRNYVVNFGATLSRILAYSVDDAFYGLPAPGFLASIRPGLDELTPAKVDAALKKHLRMQNMWIVVITKDAEGFKQKLLSGEPTAIDYAGPQSEEVLAEDKIIASYPIPVKEENIRIIDINDVFEAPQN